MIFSKGFCIIVEKYFSYEEDLVMSFVDLMERNSVCPVCGAPIVSSFDLWCFRCSNSECDSYQYQLYMNGFAVSPEDTRALFADKFSDNSLKDFLLKQDAIDLYGYLSLFCPIYLRNALYVAVYLTGSRDVESFVKDLGSLSIDFPDCLNVCPSLVQLELWVTSVKDVLKYYESWVVIRPMNVEKVSCIDRTMPFGVFGKLGCLPSIQAVVSLLKLGVLMSCDVHEVYVDKKLGLEAACQMVSVVGLFDNMASMKSFSIKYY